MPNGQGRIGSVVRIEDVAKPILSSGMLHELASLLASSRVCCLQLNLSMPCSVLSIQKWQRDYKIKIYSYYIFVDQ